MRRVSIFLVIVILFILLPVRHGIAKISEKENRQMPEAAVPGTELTAASSPAGSSGETPAPSATAASRTAAPTAAPSGTAAPTAAPSEAAAPTAEPAETAAPTVTPPETAAQTSPAPEDSASDTTAASGQSAEEESIRDSLEERTEAAISRAEEIEEERNKPTEEELRQQERDRLSAMSLEDLTSYLWEHEVPADLIYFMDEYPETREFVTDYLYQPDTPPSKSIAGEVKKGTIPHFLQWDERWGYETYGSTYLAVSGCGPTALSEVYSGLTGKTDMNPYAMAQWAEENGFYVYGSGTAWDIMTTGAYMLGLNGWMLDGGKDSLLWALRSGYPVVCAMNPGDFTFFGHFIVLTDVDENENIKLLDSNSRIRTQKLWKADDLMWQIAGMWAFSYDG